MVTKEPSFHRVVPELYTFPCSILLSVKKLFTHTYIEYMMCDMTESFHGHLSGSTCLNPLGPFPLLGNKTIPKVMMNKPLSGNLLHQWGYNHSGQPQIFRDTVTPY